MGPGGPSSGVGATATGSDAGPTQARGLPRIGEVFNGYTVVELLGQGNMGRIYRVRDQLGRDLALKVILGQVASAEGLARFEREGQAMAAIPRHKHVIGVHSAGTSGRLPYLVLDFVEGENLDEVLRRGPLPAAQAALVSEKLSRALDHVHQSGVLHRDLKPANVLIRASDGEPLLTDFGLAGLQGADTLTRTGDVIGTPLYMAPEQLLGLHREVDGRADVWSLGVMLYEMAAGALPFPGTTMLEVTDAVLGADPPRLHDRCPDADSALTRIVNLALAKDKEERLPSPGALAAALRTWRKQRQGYEVELDLPPPPGRAARRKSLLIAAASALVLALVAISVALALRSGKSGPEPTPSAAPIKTRDGLSAKASTALEALTRASDSGERVSELEEALKSPHLRDLPEAGKFRLRAVGFTALSKLNLELLESSPRPRRLAGLIRAAGVAQTLSGFRLGGGLNIDTVLNWIGNHCINQPQLLQDPAWLKVFDAIASSGFRPSQSVSGRFLDDLTLRPNLRQSREYQRILRDLVTVGTPTFYNQYDLKKLPQEPARDAGPVAHYVYLRCLMCFYKDRNATKRDNAHRKLGALVRAQSEAFDPRTLAQALSHSLPRGVKTLDDEIRRLDAALRAGPDSFYGWDGLLFLLMSKAEERAKAGDFAGVDSAFKEAELVVDRGRNALNASNTAVRPATEAIAFAKLLERQIELRNSQNLSDAGLRSPMLPVEEVEEAQRDGRARFRRIQTLRRSR